MAPLANGVLEPWQWFTGIGPVIFVPAILIALLIWWLKF